MSVRPIQILLIDDDEDEFIFIRDMLADSRKLEFQLEWIGNTDEALKKMLQQSHDIYLLDYKLGAVSGVELLEEAIKGGCRAPIILLTGYDDEDIDKVAMDSGAADYLQKSFLTSYLLERTVRYAIYRAHMQTQAITQDRMASIGLIASSLAHEIGTPLGVIRGRAEYLAMQLKGNTEIKHNVDVITTQIDRVSGLIRSLLNLARGDKSEKITTVPVREPLKEVLDLLSHEIEQHRITIVNDFNSGAPVSIRGQSQKLHQVLLNLTVNAIHAIKKRKDQNKEGYIPKIHFSWIDQGPLFTILVEDNGCGIPDNHKPDLFRPFFTTKNPGEGTGLGLATSLWIVQAWGGKMAADSEEGVGTRFRISLPKA